MPRGEIGEAKRDELIRLRVDGNSASEIAEMLGVSRQVVSATLQAEDVRGAIQQRNAEMLEAIRDSFILAQMAAWREMRALLKSDDPKIRIMAAKDILDRGPMVRGANVSLTAETGGDDLASLSVAQLRALVGEEDVVVLDVTPEAK